MVRNLLVGSAIVLLWYTSNILVVISNKFLLSYYGFRYPMFLTGCHMVACTILGGLCSLLRLVPHQRVQSNWQLMKVTVLACVFCASVALGNVSLKYIPVSFSQAIGATTPIFTAVIALCLRCRRETALVYLALLPVVAGVIVASWAEPLFNAIGFTAAIVATAARAFKSVLQGILLADDSEKLDSMNLLLYMAPLASVVLVPAILVCEADSLASVETHARDDKWFFLYLGLNASLAFLANLSNFMVTKHTSALTLQALGLAPAGGGRGQANNKVLGNGKGVLATVASVLIFKNLVNVKSASGYAVAVAGVIAYAEAVTGFRKPGLERFARRPVSVEQEEQDKMKTVARRRSRQAAAAAMPVKVNDAVVSAGKPPKDPNASAMNALKQATVKQDSSNLSLNSSIMSMSPRHQRKPLVADALPPI